MRKKLSPLSPTSFNPVITSQTSDSEEHSVRHGSSSRNKYKIIIIPRKLTTVSSPRLAGVGAHPPGLRGGVSAGGVERPPQHLRGESSSPALRAQPRHRSAAAIQQRASPGTGTLPLPFRPLQLQSGTQTQEERFEVSMSDCCLFLFGTADVLGTLL